MKWCFIFPPYLIGISTLPSETGNPEIASFYLKCCMLFCQQTQNALKYHLVTDKTSFTVKTINFKTINYVHQTGRSWLVTLPTRWMFTMSVIVLIALILFQNRRYSIFPSLGYLIISVNVRCYYMCRWQQFCRSPRRCTGAYCIQNSPTAQCKMPNFILPEL